MSSKTVQAEPIGFFFRNGLSMAMFALFACSAIGQIVAGFRVHNAELADLGGQTLSLLAYLQSGAFAEAIFENWESEFLQMAVFVLLTRILRQRGSSESKPLCGSADVDEDPRKSSKNADAPWPVRRGGVVLGVYEHSLSLALIGLFLLSFAGHAAGGARAYSEQQALQAPCRGRRDRLLNYFSVLVRIFPKLAERVHFDRGVNLPLNLSARERLTPIEARGGTARPNW